MDGDRLTKAQLQQRTTAKIDTEVQTATHDNRDKSNHDHQH
jgi:hypothetical protein